MVLGTSQNIKPLQCFKRLTSIVLMARSIKKKLKFTGDGLCSGLDNKICQHDQHQRLTHFTFGIKIVNELQQRIYGPFYRFIIQIAFPCQFLCFKVLPMVKKNFEGTNI
jgi:hypothetical protein